MRNCKSGVGGRSTHRLLANSCMRAGMLVNVRIGSTAKGSCGEAGGGGCGTLPSQYSQKGGVEQGSSPALPVCPWASPLITQSLRLSASVPSKVGRLQSRRKRLGPLVPGCLSLNASSVTGRLTTYISFPICEMGTTVVPVGIA